MNKRGRPLLPCPSYDVLREMYAAGENPPAMAMRLGGNWKIINRWLGEIGLTYTPKKYPPLGERAWATIALIVRTGKRKMPKLYAAWDNMKKRCSGVYPQYHNSYTAKGIKVCDEWGDYPAFRSWALANGFKKGVTLDRYPNNCAGYGPTNCRWIPKSMQQDNTDRVTMLTVNGVTKPLPMWSRETGLPAVLLRARLKKGWSHEQTVLTPRLAPGNWREGVRHGKRGRRARVMSA